MVADAPVRRVATTADRVLARANQGNQHRTRFSLGESPVLRDPEPCGVDRTCHLPVVIRLRSR